MGRERDRGTTEPEAEKHEKQQWYRDRADDLGFESSRIDAGGGSCAVLTRNEAVDFLLTDDVRALPELLSLVAVRVAISPIVLNALVNRGSITRYEARTKLEKMANARDRLEAPIHRRTQQLFEDEPLGPE